MTDTNWQQVFVEEDKVVFTSSKESTTLHFSVDESRESMFCMSSAVDNGYMMQTAGADLPKLLEFLKHSTALVQKWLDKK